MSNSFKQSVRDNVVKRAVSLTGGSAASVTPARVVDIILDETHPEWDKFGKEAGIGTIKYKLLSNSYSNTSTVSLPSASPLYIHTKQYPLRNEIVLLITAPSEGLGSSTANTKTYYTDTVNIWNHPHHAGYPQEGQELSLGDYFAELNNVNPLLPFEGDRILEGRQGQSLRFSASYANKTPWISEENGKPIIVLRNGQASTQEGFSLIVEDVNQDDSSIYLTSNQRLELTEASSRDYNSYSNDPPILPKNYTGAQVLLNSGRLVLNSKEDHILLSSKKSINLNSVNSVNLDTPTVVLQADKVYLANKNATEPVLKGNATVDLLEDLLSELRNIGTKLLTATNGGGPVIAVQDAGAALIQKATTLTTQLESLKSKKTFTD